MPSQGLYINNISMVVDGAAYLDNSLADQRSIYQPDRSVVLFCGRLLLGGEQYPVILRALSCQDTAHSDSNAGCKSRKID
jgi:hypothetical protein